jgi:formate dehydrogenase major subunit
MEQNAIVVFSEKHITPATGAEMFNLAMLTGKLGKTANGLISLKEKNNGQGLIDMGIMSDRGVGNQSLTDKKFAKKLRKLWGVDKLPELPEEDPITLMKKGEIKKYYIFGEDPLGCAIDKERIMKWLSDAEFVMVQDYFITETAQEADLILPATFPLETSGTFTNTQRYIQQFEKQLKSKVEKEGYQQILEMMDMLKVKNKFKNAHDVRKEIIKLLPENVAFEYNFEYTMDDSEETQFFNHGCDILVKKFDDKFDNAFKAKKKEFVQVEN